VANKGEIKRVLSPHHITWIRRREAAVEDESNLAHLLEVVGEPWWRRTAGIGGAGETLARVGGGACADFEDGRRGRSTASTDGRQRARRAHARGGSPEADRDGGVRARAAATRSD
jgi:hypothetical protein